MTDTNHILDGLHVLLVSDDGTRVQQLLSALRDQGARAFDVSAPRDDDAALMAADLFVVDTRASTARKARLQQLRSDVRGRWVPQIEIDFADVVLNDGTVQLVTVLDRCEPVFAPESALTERARRDAELSFALTPLGPTRILRALAKAGPTLHVELSGRILHAEVELANELLVSATAEEGTDRFEAWGALVRVLGMEEADVRVARRAFPAGMNVMEPLAQALEVAAQEHHCGTDKIARAAAEASAEAAPPAPAPNPFGETPLTRPQRTLMGMAVPAQDRDARPFVPARPARQHLPASPRTEARYEHRTGPLGAFSPNMTLMGVRAPEPSPSAAQPSPFGSLAEPRAATPQSPEDLSSLARGTAPVDLHFDDEPLTGPLEASTLDALAQRSEVRTAPPTAEAEAKVEAEARAKASVQAEATFAEVEDEDDEDAADQATVVANRSLIAALSERSGLSDLNTLAKTVVVDRASVRPSAPEHEGEGADAGSQAEPTNGSAPPEVASHAAPHASSALEEEEPAGSGAPESVSVDFESSGLAGLGGLAELADSGHLAMSLPAMSLLPEAPADTDNKGASVPTQQQATVQISGLPRGPQEIPGEDTWIGRKRGQGNARAGRWALVVAAAALLGGLYVVSRRQGEPATPTGLAPMRAEVEPAVPGSTVAETPAPAAAPVAAGNPPAPAAPIPVAVTATSLVDAPASALGAPRPLVASKAIETKAAPVASAPAAGEGDAPNVADALVQDGNALLAQHNRPALEKARALFERAVSADRQNPHGHAGLAQAQLGLGDREAARRSISEAIRLRARRARYRVLLGDVLVALGKPGEAKASWEAALALDPKDTEAKARLSK